MSYTSEQLPNFIKIDTQPNLQIAFKMEEGYKIPNQNECISYLLEQINDMKQKYEYLEKLILSK
jgi:hypothetical protein